MRESLTNKNVAIPTGQLVLSGEIVSPPEADALIIFAHGSGSSRHSPRNQAVATTLHRNGLATLLFDLLTETEEQEDDYDGRLRFNIPLLGERLILATRWVQTQPEWRQKSIGYFGASTGAAAALIAAAELGLEVSAVVSRGGRPDLAGNALAKVHSPVLLIVGERDEPVVRLNKQAQRQIQCERRLVVVPQASHLFEEPGALAQVAQLASEWFLNHLPASAAS